MDYLQEQLHMKLQILFTQEEFPKYINLQSMRFYYIFEQTERTKKLILSSHPTYARLHLTNQNYDSPAIPPMFCMLLRKHLEGGFIEKIEQIDLERIIQITVRSRNEIGDESLKTLVIEIMGRHSNIILVDTKTNVILDSLKHISLAVNRHRTVYAGAEYIAPPAQHKINPLQIETNDEFIRPLDFLSGNMDKQLVGTLREYPRYSQKK